MTRGEADSFAGPWSPDGQRIVYTAFGPTNSTIAVISGLTNLTNDPADEMDEMMDKRLKSEITQLELSDLGRRFLAL